MVENKTKATKSSVEDFLQTVDVQKRQDCEALIAIMQEITGEVPTLWGASIIGFGSVHYAYDSGREGDMPAAGFSPRKVTLTIYIADGFNEYGALLDKLGPHTVSVSCLYIKRLSDVDLPTLKKIIFQSYKTLTTTRTKPSVTTIDEYIMLQPDEQQTRLKTIRSIIHTYVPDGVEAIAYEIPTVRVNNKNVIHFSGYADHVSIYPVPKSLVGELKPYIRGKGTLWFSMDEPLPERVVARAVSALAKERTKK